MRALPNFLVIGAQRAGTTLLHYILDAHPQVYVPRRRKEIHYFDWYFDRGAEWYAGFFPEGRQATKYRAIGEVTPDYLFEERAPQRIRAVLPGCRFVVSLRDPLRRAYSWYLFSLRSFNEQRTFDEFLRGSPETLERGLYSQQLRRYFEVYPRSQFIILIYEELLADPAPHLSRLAEFLGLSCGWQDPVGLTRQRINASEIPRFRAAFARAQRIGEAFTRRDLDWVVWLARSFGIPRMFGTRSSRPELSEGARCKLMDYYRDEITNLENMLGRDLSVWLSDTKSPVRDHPNSA